MKKQLISISLISLLLVGCGNIVENLQEGNFQDSLKLAKEIKPEEINKRYEEGGYPLIVALEKKQYPIAKILINKNANVNITQNGLSPLDIVIINDIKNNAHLDIAQLLVKKGAKLYNRDKVISTIISNDNKQYFDFLVKNNLEKELLISKLLNSDNVNLIKYAISKKLFTNEQILEILSDFTNKEMLDIVSKNYSLSKILDLAISNENHQIITFFLENKVELNKDEIRQIIYLDKDNSFIKILYSNYPKFKSVINNIAKAKAIQNSDNDLLTLLIDKKNINLSKNDIKQILNNSFSMDIKQLIYKKYPKYRKMMFTIALNNNDEKLLLFMLSHGFKLNAKLLAQIAEKDFDVDTIKQILLYAKHLKNTAPYKKLSMQIKKAEIKNKWHQLVKSLNEGNFNKAGTLIRELNRISYNVDKDINQRVVHIGSFPSLFANVHSKENKNRTIKRLKKLLVGKNFLIAKTEYLKSGPCFFGLCAGHNEATALLTVRIVDILDDSYAKLKIVGIKIKRNSVSDWDVYNRVVADLKSKYKIGDILQESIADTINEKMWKIHASGNREGYSKKDLGFIGIFMSDTLSTVNTRDTGNWLVFDNINCDAGIYINRMEQSQMHKNVFENSYKKMYKKCGWDKIK